MDESVVSEIEALRGLTTGGLKKRYRELFGQESRSSNKQFLFRRIAWRIQAQAEGDLSERSKKRALEISRDADLRIRPPAGFEIGTVRSRNESDERKQDGRRPQAGAILTRRYGDRQIVVKVLAQGFEYQGRTYRSLSAIAREVTGTRWNGLLFFGLKGRDNE